MFAELLALAVVFLRDEMALGLSAMTTPLDMRYGLSRYRGLAPGLLTGTGMVMPGESKTGGESVLLMAKSLDMG